MQEPVEVVSARLHRQRDPLAKEGDEELARGSWKAPGDDAHAKLLACCLAFDRDSRHPAGP